MGAAAQLLITRDGEVLKKQPLEGEVDVGRAEGCVVRLEDRAISRQHALFRPVGDGFQVEKKSEFGPLTVNGAECTRAFLKEGDVISIGPYLVKYQAGAGATAAAGATANDAAPIAAADLPLTPLVPPVDSVTQALPSSDQTVPVGNTAAAAAAFAEMTSSQVAMPDLGALPPVDTSLSMGDVMKAANAGAPDGATVPIANEGSLVLDAPLSMEPSSSIAPPLDGVQSVEGGPVGGVGDLSLSLDGAAGAKLEGGTPSGLTTGPVDQDAATKIQSSSDLKAKLLLKSGVASATEFEFENRDEISIGRGRDCEIIVDDKKVSRKNTIIRREGNRYIIKDLESANGTFVNGAQVKELQLYGEDVVKIGNTEFKFVALSDNYAKREQEFSEVAAAAAPAISLGATGDPGGSLPNELQIPDINLPPPIEGGSPRPVEISAGPMQIPTPSQLLSAPPLVDPLMSPNAIQPPPATPGMTDIYQSPAFPPGAMPGEKTINVLGIPGIPGAIPGVGTPGKADKGLMAKFRRLPKRMQWIVILVVIAGCWTLLWDDDEFNVEPPVKKSRPSPKPSAKPTEPVSPTFENLSPEKKRFVEAQHNLAFDYYRNKDYGRALYEIQKIFDIIPDYKDSREIERYSKEGKRKQDAIEEERRRKEEEARLKAKIAQFVDEARLRMKKKQYEQAREIFPKILALDPDNVDVSGWKKDIEDWEEKQKLAEQEKQIQREINDRAWGVYKRGLALKRQRRYHTAIVIFGKLVEDGTSDRKLIYLSRKQIASSRALITARRKPVFAAAAAAEKNSEFAKAMRLYARAAAIDPSYGPSAAGLSRVKKVLHDRAKVIYTEAVLAESYSDFETAKARYKEIVNFAPGDDIYFERAQRKLGRYFQRGVAQE